MMKLCYLSHILLLTFLSLIPCLVQSFAPILNTRLNQNGQTSTTSLSLFARTEGRTLARDLVKGLVEDDKCYTTEIGARAFGDACATNIVYEDCFEPQPIVGRLNVIDHMLAKVNQRKGKGGFRLDRITDGNKSCGFAWTWTCGDEEGLRGTSFVELNDAGEIQYVREIPEPIYKPGDLTVELLKAVTEGAEPKKLDPLVEREPKVANDVVKYLFKEVQGRSVDISMKCFSDEIVYRDFNYEEVLKGKTAVEKFIEDFSFPGIEFKTQRIDDGVLSCGFTWEVVLMDAPETVKGISLYELDPDSRLITYVRDVPESAIKPPILGKLARQLRPGLG